MSRHATAWVVALVPSGAVLALCRLAGVDSDVIAALLLVPVMVAAWIGGRQVGLRVGLTVAVGYSFALLTPFGHLRIGLTRDMLVLALYGAVGAGVGWVADRRRPQVESVVGDERSGTTALLNAVSHDLRNPLSTIRAASSDLRDAHHDADPHRQELLDLVVTETERLDRIVANLLSAGRAQAGRIVVDAGPESIHDIVEAALGRLARLHPQQLVNGVSGDLPPVFVDSSMVDQVLSNLVDNASRVSPPSSSIIVTAAHCRNQVWVAVADAGPGFDPALGDPFEPYESTSGSSGLGLAICRTIVNAHGGDITVVNDGAQGARVRFTLPVAADV